MESAQQPFTASPPLRPSSPAEEDTTPVALDAAHTTSLACIPGVEKSTIQGILRLPDDILGEISLQSMVSYLKTDDAFGDQLGAHFCDLYDCFAVSHVCRRWKYAALATPCAWATIKLSKSTDCISAMIERSGQVPLLVYEDTFLWDDNVTASKELVFQEMHRIMHLRILVDNKVCDFLSNLEVADAPLLKTLHLTYSEHYDEQPFDSIPALSSWAMPSLVHLSIHDKSEWDGDGMPELTLVKPLLRSTITELEIDELKTPIPVEACLDLLHGLPMLKRLTFGGVLSRPQGNLGNLLLPVADNIVSLCHLRNFSFQRTSRWSHRDQMDLGVGAAELLRHLDIPASTTSFSQCYAVRSLPQTEMRPHSSRYHSWTALLTYVRTSDPPSRSS
ncbi:hypothetical protein BC835DRAFT_1076299 [Cytidiella melzeri]|nr:hypothetical protein BC835DRAFT_1076299 [Cytidiella melzeri]